ncbi:hypothetical protein [Hylemonella gracilis]|uniref:hypothetical protein n=1 Tax=Hylemonella gracilis TaxID=80880 RepID=UPI00111032AD|nr:hypothetical protein [Hylemonella gracilis]
MKYLKVIAIFFIASFQFGCSSIKKFNDPEAGLSNPARGNVLVSITAEPEKYTHDAWIFIRKKGASGDVEPTRLAAFGFTLMGFQKPNDYPEVSPSKGRLVAASLEPGEYELYNWQLYIAVFGGNGYISPKDPPAPIYFTIKPSTTTYLGRIHIGTVLAKNIVGMNVAAGASPKFSNHFKRDSEIATQKFSSFATWPIDQVSIAENIWLPRE